MRRLIKGEGFAIRISIYILLMIAGRACLRTEKARRAFSLKLDWAIARWLLKGLDVRVHGVHAPISTRSEKPRFYVANHVSDIDILALASLTRVAFITSVEIRDHSFLGKLAVLGGCLFVERRNKFGLRAELGQITQSLKEGFDLALFAEGTSSNGESVLPFKNTLLQSAIDAEAVLVPVCINYLAIDGIPLSPSNRDSVFYYGNMDFLPHLKALLGVRSIDVECRFLEPIPLKRVDNRKEICERAYQKIVKHYVPINKERAAPQSSEGRSLLLNA